MFKLNISTQKDFTGRYEAEGPLARTVTAAMQPHAASSLVATAFAVAGTMICSSGMKEAPLLLGLLVAAGVAQALQYLFPASYNLVRGRDRIETKPGITAQPNTLDDVQKANNFCSIYKRSALAFVGVAVCVGAVMPSPAAKICAVSLITGCVFPNVLLAHMWRKVARHDWVIVRKRPMKPRERKKDRVPAGATVVLGRQQQLTWRANKHYIINALRCSSQDKTNPRLNPPALPYFISFCASLI